MGNIVSFVKEDHSSWDSMQKASKPIALVAVAETKVWICWIGMAEKTQLSPTLVVLFKCNTCIMV